MTRFVDSHAHLDAAQFNGDREAVIARAQEAGLRYVLLIADLTRPESMRAVIDLVERHQNFYWAAGIDPHESAKAQEEHFQTLAEAAQHPKFLAVGEIGLDYYHDYPRDDQKRVFLRQIELAREIERPIIIHCRDAWSDVREILRQRLRPHDDNAACEASLAAPESSDEPRAGILHCFTGAVEDARELLTLGFYVSFAGNITYKKAENLREAARLIPLQRLLSETDCPYLAPVPHRGERNEPARVREVTCELARLHGLPEDVMGRQLVENFARLFELGKGL
ncbi:MAG TPA: TatD family hydrolase [Terriglobia bacterium]|nr:TatD family hydrolase [Terriglobia bacterium]